MDIQLFAIFAQALAFLVVSLVAYWMAKDYRVKTAVALAVKAAEQVMTDPGSGELKKEWVIDQITRRFKVKREYVEVLIEAFVFELNRS